MRVKTSASQGTRVAPEKLADAIGKSIAPEALASAIPHHPYVTPESHFPPPHSRGRGAMVWLAIVVLPGSFGGFLYSRFDARLLSSGFALHFATIFVGSAAISYLLLSFIAGKRSDVQVRAL